MYRILKNPHSEPLISIITVVLNGAEFLEKAFESVFSQSFENIEYIVIDGGSSDESVEIIKKHSDKLKYWVSENDEGIYDAMNKGVKAATGKWVYFLGSDDFMMDCLNEVAKYLKNENVVYYGDVYRPKLKRTYDGMFSAYKLACRNICQQSIFYPRKVWDKYSFNLAYQIYADFDFNIRCFVDSQIHFQYIPVIISVYNDNDGLSCNGRDVEFERDRLALVRDHFPLFIYLRFWARMKMIKLIDLLGITNIMLKLYRKIFSKL